MAKIIPFIIGLFTLLFGLFLKTNKTKGAAYKELTFWGYVLSLIIPVIVLGWGVYNTYNEQLDSARKEQKIKDDSVTIAQRWLHDTTRLKQIIDSSEKIINETNSTLKNSTNVLNDIKQVDEKSVKNLKYSVINLKNWDQLKYPLYPLEIRIQYTCKLDKSQFNTLVPEYSADSLSTVFERLPYKGMHEKTISILKDNKHNSNLFRKLVQGTMIIGFSNTKYEPVANTSWMSKVIFLRSIGFEDLVSDSTYSEIELTYGTDIVTLTVTRFFKNALLENIIPFGIVGIKDLDGLYIFSALYKPERYNAKINYISFITGTGVNRATRMNTYSLSKEYYGNEYIFQAKIGKSNFVNIH